MELGEKLKTARQEAGLSQRQLCGDVITRNMLSQIEHGTARPSMETLRYLASRLGKPLSWFLEEDTAVSSNQALMEQVRKADAGQAWLLLKTFHHPDLLLEWEWNLRSFLAGLGAAEQAIEAEKWLYARQLLEEVQSFEHGIPELERKRLWLLGRIPGADLPAIVQQLPPMDAELLLRAEAALAAKDAEYGDILCMCANITRGEIREAVRRGAVSVDGVKRRIGSGMGSCQGSRCRTAIEEMIREMLEGKCDGKL